jgi:alkylated DNA repair dioxygenase AlkB
MRGGAVNLTGPGALRLTGDVHRSLLVEGEIYFTLPPDAHILEEFDLVGFRHCVATEGGQDIPAPPSKDYELSGRPVPSVRSTVAHERIDGLFYIAPFVGENEADDVVRSIDSAPWRRDLKRRVQHYGWRYDYRDHAVDESMHLGPLPPWAQRLAERLHREGHLPHVADQVIVNEYVEKQGISKHVDCEECFEDGIAMLSLLEPWEMVFRRGKEKIGIELEPRSVAVMKGDARYAWSHEIPARLTEPSGLRRRRRLSVTFRKVIPSSAQPKKKTRKR